MGVGTPWGSGAVAPHPDFPGGVGNTWKDSARFTQLLDDVTSRIFARYDDATWVYPGHGADTTLGVERPHLDEWRDRGW
jgi:glyoxylase-like metal-dependent hydrolase (beta-lactamase superfamily II)